MPDNRRTPATLARAFTLVEILMALLILGIASAVIVPQLGSRDDVIASAAARSITADLMYAQNQALAEQRPWFVQFTTTSYTIYDDQAMLTPVDHPINKEPYVVATGTTSGFERITFGAVNFSGQTTFGFDDLGTPFVVGGGGAAVPITNPGTIPVTCDDHTLTISVAPFTGQITIN